ncbi:hypothetical protein SCD_n00984 [Sulfuricella denitrificans skB26]|uniref:Uncharacterized protein n=1 Tax=Sulfuricella denitrificans (strain DSM 22764 / NBRC 105220 / skB26) TaxID=1163617 RepID=S6ABL9_SULDS|nr:hypothetical protein SCD_n00984 [Sulfuricella denitrificans skB26]
MGRLLKNFAMSPRNETVHENQSEAHPFDPAGNGDAAPEGRLTSGQRRRKMLARSGKINPSPYIYIVR